MGELAPWVRVLPTPPDRAQGVVSPMGAALLEGLEAPKLRARDGQGKVTACSCRISPSS